MTSNPIIDFLGAVVVFGLLGVSLWIIIEFVVRYASDPRDHPSDGVIEEYRREQAAARRKWREFVRKNHD